MNLDELLERSDALDDVLMHLLGAESFRLYDGSPRIVSSFAACSVSLDHARGLRTLMREGLPTPAISLTRLQHEAVTRSVWLLYAASETDLEKFQSPLTLDAGQAGNNPPMLAGMLTAIEGKAPLGATQMLKHMKDMSTAVLNSYVHGGVHVLRRQSEGYPLPLLLQVVRNSNGLLTMSGMMFAILSGDPAMAKRVSRIQPDFADCLPDLLPAAPA